MADISDVMDALVGLAFGACYPQGASGASLTGQPISVAGGWPLAEDINTALAAGQSLVSVYPLPAPLRAALQDVLPSTPQVMNFLGSVLAPFNGGLTLSVSGQSVSASGVAAVGEYVTLVVNGGQAFSYVTALGESAADVLTALSGLVSVDFPDAEIEGGAVVFPSAYRLVARSGGPGTAAAKLHRQVQEFQVVTWAPNPADRTTIGRAVDLAIKTPVRITMPDTSDALINARETRLSDGEQNQLLYRRDLIIAVQFDTVGVIPGYEVTTVQSGIATNVNTITQNI